MTDITQRQFNDLRAEIQRLRASNDRMRTLVIKMLENDPDDYALQVWRYDARTVLLADQPVVDR